MNYAYFKKIFSHKVYADHSAATPMSAQVKKAMRPFYTQHFANTGGLYKQAQYSALAFDDAKQRLAKITGFKSAGIIFTGGATESNNLAIIGVVTKYRQDNTDTPHVIISATEHDSVRQPVIALHAQGLINFDEVPVDSFGVIKLDEFKKLLRPQTVLVSVHHGHSEIGTMQPVTAIAKAIHYYRRTLKRFPADLPQYPYLHVDASQTVSFAKVGRRQLLADLVTLSPAKCNGPKGVAVLAVHKSVQITNVMYGGDQQSGLRPGTFSTALAVGAAQALKDAQQACETYSKKMQALQQQLINNLQPYSSVFSVIGDLDERLPNHVALKIANIDSDIMVIELDARQVACSARTACKFGQSTISPVLQALGWSQVNYDRDGMIRLSFGVGSSKKDVVKITKALVSIAKKYGQL